MSKRLKSVKLRLEAREALRKENDARSTKFYRQLLNPKTASIPKWTVIAEECDFTFEPRRSFREVKISLIRQAQLDVHGSDIAKLKTGEGLGKKNFLVKLKPFLNEKTDLLEVRGRFSSQDRDRHLIFLPKGHPVTKLIIRDMHTEKLAHFGAITNLMAEVRKHYFSPHLKSLVVKLLDNCYECRRRYPHTFKQEMSPFHPGKIPGRLGEGESPFSFGGCVNADFAGPFLTSQGRGKTRAKRWVFVFVCAATKAIYLQLVYSSATSDILTGLLTFFMRKGVPRRLISDCQTGLRCSDKEIKDIRERIVGLQERLHERLHDFDFCQFDWQFTAPRTPTANGQCERYMATLKSAMIKMSHFNPKGSQNPPHHKACLTDKEMEFLLVRVETVMNAAPLCQSLNQNDDAEPLTRAHFSVGSNSPIRLNVPEEILKSGNQYTYKWFAIEEALLEFWARWNSEHLDTIRKVPRWNSGDVNLSPGDLIMVVDRNDPEMTKRIKWPVARVESFERDAEGRIQTVTIKYRSNVTRRGIRSLAPLPGVDF